MVKIIYLLTGLGHKRQMQRSRFIICLKKIEISKPIKLFLE